jgi:2-polyprenyl-3-methyl-5-hydroxy-6-metoxy-1,4-benzoquinol methylase
MSMNQGKYDYSHQYFEQGMLGWHKQSFHLITKGFETTFHDKQIDSILDFGSGDGFYGSFLKNYAANVDGMDISEELKQHTNSVHYRNFAQADLAGEIENSEKYAVVFSSEVIEHVLDYKSFLENARFVTQKNGYLFLTTTTFAFSIFVYLLTSPGKFRFKEVQKYFSGLFGNEKMRTAFLQNIWSWTKGHYHGFSKNQMRKGLQQTGWEVVSITYLKAQPLIYNDVFLNPFKNVRFRYLIIVLARILYLVTNAVNWTFKKSGIYASNIIVIAKNTAG